MYNLFQSCLLDLIIFQAFRYAPLEYPFISLRDLSCITAFGFLAGREVKDAGAGNLGLRDRAYFHRKQSTRSQSTVFQSAWRSSGYKSTFACLVAIPQK
jgi:hypothetical protein